MRMRVRVGLLADPGKIVIVLMMRVMYVHMGVAHSQVFMRMLVVFREMQPDAEGHQRPGNQ
jgi:hypothetical protein